ncbi:MAG: MFS transporter [Oligoflexia bacterium]|nr:MFS transporter [Oligoflexia bacterium]
MEINEETENLGFKFLTLFLAAYLFAIVANTVSVPLITLYGIESNYGAKIIGYIIAIVGISRFIFSFFLGWMGDYFGHKRVYFIGFLLFFISSILFISSNFLSLVYLARIMQGLALGAIAISSQSIIAHASSGLQSKKLIAKTNSIQNIGMVIGPASASFFTEIIGVKSSIMLVAVVALMGAVTTFFMPFKDKKIDKEEKININKLRLMFGLREFNTIWSNPIIKYTIMMNSFIFAVIGAWLTLWPFFLKGTLGLSSSNVSLFYAIYPIGGIFVGPIFGKKIGNQNSMPLFLMATAFTLLPPFAILLHVENIMVYGLLVMFSGISGSIYFILHGYNINKHLPRSQFGALLGKINAFSWLFNAAAASTIGIVIHHLGIIVASIFYVLLVLVHCFFGIMVFKRVNDKTSALGFHATSK